MKSPGLRALLVPILLSGCMAQADLFEASSDGQVWREVARARPAQPDDGPIVPSVRPASAESPAAARPNPPQPAGWVTAMQAPVRLRDAGPPQLRGESPAPVTANAAPTMRQTLVEAPAARTALNRPPSLRPASAPPTNIVPPQNGAAPDSRPVALLAGGWNVAPSASVKIAQSPETRQEWLPAPAGGGAWKAAEAASPGSGPQLRRP